MAGSDAVYEAAFKRAGILRVNDLEALFDAVSTLGMLQPIAGDRLALLTNGGGIGVMATDTLIYKQGTLARLADATIERLNAILPSTWSHGNPVDIIGDATPPRYVEALTAVMDDPGVDAVLVMNCPTAITSSTEAAQAVLETIRQGTSRAGACGVLSCWIGDGPAEAARQLFREQGIPSYETPTKAVRGFMQMVRYRHGQAMLMEVPPDIPETFIPDRRAARRVIDAVLAAGRSWLLETEAKTVLAAYGIPVVPTVVADSPEAAAQAASPMAKPVVLKILSSTVLHKSDAGGVALNLETAAAVHERASWMREQFGRQASPQDLRFSVQPMVRKPHAHELIVGMSLDPQFGPVLLFGHGGTATEVIHDRCLALPPLNMNLARDMIVRTRVSRLLAGYRNRQAVDMDQLCLALMRVSQMVIDIPEILELDINPLWSDEKGVLALDARMRIEPSEEGAKRLAIRPYPKELEEAFEMRSGRRVLLRPIRPEDEPRHHEFIARLTPQDIRFRFFGALKRLPHSEMAKLTQIDYDREMAFLATGMDEQGRQETLGVVRAVTDANNHTAEYAVVVRYDLKGERLGWKLLTKMIEYCRARGTRVFMGEVLTHNRNMLGMAKAMGFTISPSDDEGIRKVMLELNPRNQGESV
jgi:acetyltransferase